MAAAPLAPMLRNSVRRISVNAARTFSAGNVGSPDEGKKPADAPIDVPSRVLMGPGPSNIHPRATAAMTLPELGHLHTPFLRIMDETMKGLKYVFQTESNYVCAVSGPGHAAMEASIVNMLEQGQKILVGNNGIWGSRIVDMARRIGAEPIDFEREAGRGYSFQEIKEAIEKHKARALPLVGCGVSGRYNLPWVAAACDLAVPRGELDGGVPEHRRHRGRLPPERHHLHPRHRVHPWRPAAQS